MQAISKGLEKVIQELIASENDGSVSENFCRILKEFLNDAEAEVRSLAQLYANVGRNADALVLYFGEDLACCPFEQIVIFNKFILSFISPSSSCVLFQKVLVLELVVDLNGFQCNCCL